VKKKICMIGAFGVGKTSLVRRFVDGFFGEKYLTTVGVKIDRKDVSAGGESVALMLWDLAGEDDLSPLQTALPPIFWWPMDAVQRHWLKPLNCKGG